MFHRTRHLVREGDAARDSQDWPRAQRAYAAALRRKPGLAHIWVQHGHALKEQGLRAEALAAYRRADALLPDQADTLLQIGRVLETLGETAAAIEHLERSAALARQPGDADRALRRLRPEPVPAAPPPEAAAERLRAKPVLARPPTMPERLRFVALGTTGTCNASCIHCPTGKAETAHVPRGTMPMELFQKVIDGIVAFDLPIRDQVSFGLFGDGLVDPLVVERAVYLRERLPDVSLSVNTNGAAFNLAKHGALRGLASTIALHCESLDPATYDDLMRPLRLERVMPKLEAVLEAFPGLVHVSVPLSRRNYDEAGAIRDWFTARGARVVVFDPLSSRCAEDRTLFESLALNPHPIRCGPDVMDDLIVDTDGQVLVCCQDFQRIEGVGSFADESFEEVMAGLARQRARAIMAERRHEEMATCSRCYADVRGEFAPA